MVSVRFLCVNGKSVTIDIDSSLTVFVAKLELARKLGPYQPNQIKLIYHSHPLDENATIKSLNLNGHDYIIFDYPYKALRDQVGRIEKSSIRYLREDGRFFKDKLYPFTTIHQVKDRLSTEKVVSVPKERLDLIFHSQFLKNENTLESYHIDTNKYIVVDQHPY